MEGRCGTLITLFSSNFLPLLISLGGAFDIGRQLEGGVCHKMRILRSLIDTGHLSDSRHLLAHLR